MKNCQRFLRMYSDLISAPIVKPRGMPVKELEDYVLRLKTWESPCTDFVDRKFNLAYAKSEVVWYLGADKFDRSIDERSSMWPKLVQPDGSYFSNYGQYIFGEGQFDWVVDELTRDRDSRRASIILLKKEHAFADNKDMVCTYSMNFRIRSGTLNVSVNMRSNDAVFGTTNDVFSFFVVHRMVLAALWFGGYRELNPGSYVHKVDSLHVYERHWNMIESIVSKGEAAYSEIDMPYVTTPEELEFLLSKPKHDANPPPRFELAHWLWNRG